MEKESHKITLNQYNFNVVRNRIKILVMYTMKRKVATELCLLFLLIRATNLNKKCLKNPASISQTQEISKVGVSCF